MTTESHMELWINLSNLLFEMEQQHLAKSNNSTMVRYHQRMTRIVESAGFRTYNPIGEPYSETRTDLEATILKNACLKKAVIGEVLKPVIYRKEADGSYTLLQRGVVIVK